MYLAQVIGTVVATVKYEGLEGYRFMVVKPVRDDGRPAGPTHVALDAAQAGVGERVMCVSSREAALACDHIYLLNDPDTPVSLGVSAASAGLYPMANGLSRLQTRFLATPEAVDRVLADLDLADRETLLVWNKADTADPGFLRELVETFGGRVVSARSGQGFAPLLDTMERTLFRQRRERTHRLETERQP